MPNYYKWRSHGSDVYRGDDPVATAWEFSELDAEAIATMIAKSVKYHEDLVFTLRNLVNNPDHTYYIACADFLLDELENADD
jgi:hypothetical protein